jgi:hypothetical protein
MVPFMPPAMNPEKNEIDNILGYHRRLLMDPDSTLE